MSWNISIVDPKTNEVLHVAGLFESSVLPIDVPEMNTTANFILRKIKEKDPDQNSALIQSIEVTEELAEELQTR